ncbi:MAG: hypothetical protein ACPGSM_08795 [Thiolinea sp.]
MKALINQMKVAMSSFIPSTHDLKAMNQMKESMTEHRQGAHANPASGDRQIRAMSNEFELVVNNSIDPMKAAMSEQRAVYLEPKNIKK